MQHNLAKEFTYQIGWRSRGRHAGRHASAQRGLGMDFVGHAPLIAYPDPRRIDLRLTLRDPAEQVFVRIFNQRSATPVYVVCDLSGSMGFAGEYHKLGIAAEITASVAYSAARIHDPFTFIGYDDSIREDWIAHPATRLPGAYALADRLQDYKPGHVGSRGLLDLAPHLSRERSLVFLVSDFHMPIAQLESALVNLQIGRASW